jgi:hypothetical protein
VPLIQVFRNVQKPSRRRRGCLNKWGQSGRFLDNFVLGSRLANFNSFNRAQSRGPWTFCEALRAGLN